MSKLMTLTRISVALIWAFAMLGAVGAMALTGGEASAAYMKEKDKGNGGGNQGNGGGNQGNGGSDEAPVVDDGSGDVTGGEEVERWVTICHATGSGSFNEITVNVNATEGGHGNHADDIIPAPEGGCPAGSEDDDTDEDGDDTDEETDGDTDEDDSAGEDETDGEDGDGDGSDGGEDETEVVVDIDEDGQGTITFDLDGDGEVDFTITVGQGNDADR